MTVGNEERSKKKKKMAVRRDRKERRRDSYFKFKILICADIWNILTLAQSICARWRGERALDSDFILVSDCLCVTRNEIGPGTAYKHRDAARRGAQRRAKIVAPKMAHGNVIPIRMQKYDPVFVALECALPYVSFAPFAAPSRLPRIAERTMRIAAHSKKWWILIIKQLIH